MPVSLSRTYDKQRDNLSDKRTKTNKTAENPCDSGELKKRRYAY